jgi:hypothetical protein
MLDPHREIQALVDDFVAEVGELAKRLAIAQLHTAFGEGAAPALTRPAKSAGRADAALASLAAPPSPSARSAASPPAGRRSRTRRAQGELEVMRDKLLAAIAARPGRRTEELNEMLGTRTPEIAQLLRGLVSESRVRTEGARRGTRYFLVAEPPASRRSAGSRASDATA